LKSECGCSGDLGTVSIADVVIADAEHVVFDPAVASATSGSMCDGMPGVVCRVVAAQTRRMVSPGTPWARRKRRPSSALSTSKGRLVPAELLVQAEVVEHRPHTQQLRVEAEASVAALQAAEPEDPPGTVHHAGGGLAYQFSGLTCHLRVGDRHPGHGLPVGQHRCLLVSREAQRADAPCCLSAQTWPGLPCRPPTPLPAG
jgi:hypothetical protein